MSVEAGDGRAPTEGRPAGAAAPASRGADLEAGRRLGEYDLVSPLGEGGFASVWLARHRFWPERAAAAKVIRDPDQLHQLRAEARCLAGLAHENIARAIGLDLEHDPPYLLVELHEGRTLRQVLEQDGPLPPARVKRLFAQVVAALACSHAQGVVHGDVKPENILVAPDDRVKVADFGLGRVRALQTSTLISQSILSGDARAVAGTIPYMAPEQQAGQPPDARTDVFTLGILLHELATGARPQPGDELGAALPDDPAYAAAFAGCYARRERRFADATELAAALPLAAAVEGGEAGAAARTAGVEADPAPAWTPEEVEDAVCREAGIDLDTLRRGALFAGAGARTTTMFLLHRHLGLTAAQLAERYDLPARKVRAKLDNGVPSDSLLVGVGERLAPLPPDAARRLYRLDWSLTLWLAATITTCALGVAAIIASGALVVSWTFETEWMAAAMLALTFGLSTVMAMAFETCRRRYLAERERLAEVLPSIEAADDRARLERIAMRYDLPLVRRRARALLEGAPAALDVGTARPRSLEAPRRAATSARVRSPRATSARSVEAGRADTTFAPPPLTRAPAVVAPEPSPAAAATTSSGAVTTHLPMDLPGELPQGVEGAGTPLPPALAETAQAAIPAASLATASPASLDPATGAEAAASHAATGAEAAASAPPGAAADAVIAAPAPEVPAVPGPVEDAPPEVCRRPSLDEALRQVRAKLEPVVRPLPPVLEA